MRDLPSHEVGSRPLRSGFVPSRSLGRPFAVSFLVVAIVMATLSGCGDGRRGSDRDDVWLSLTCEIPATGTEVDGEQMTSLSLLVLPNATYFGSAYLSESDGSGDGTVLDIIGELPESDIREIAGWLTADRLEQMGDDLQFPARVDPWEAPFITLGTDAGSAPAIVEHETAWFYIHADDPLRPATAEFFQFMSEFCEARVAEGVPVTLVEW